jgi:glycosyltransferase involved in cell wall biosynthesis
VAQSPNAETLILLSAFNGEKYIAAQIESILAQSVSDWRLLIRDDGSRDATQEIVKRFVEHDSRVTLASDDGANVGPWESFGRLLAHAKRDRDARYVFLSDQDDVWIPEKLDKQLKLLTSNDGRDGERKRPRLVHSDLIVVSEDLYPLHQSFSDFQRMYYDVHDPLGTLLIHNAAVGCTIGMNRELLELAVPLPPRVLHDWWLALCAAATGTVFRTARPTVLYRQHSSNVVGTGNRHAFLLEAARNPLRYTSTALQAFNIGVEQAKQLRERLRDHSEHSAVLIRVEKYCDAFSSSLSSVERIRALAESRPRPHRLTSKIILRALAAFYPFATRHFLRV